MCSNSEEDIQGADGSCRGAVWTDGGGILRGRAGPDGPAGCCSVLLVSVWDDDCEKIGGQEMSKGEKFFVVLLVALLVWMCCLAVIDGAEAEQATQGVKVVRAANAGKNVISLKQLKVKGKKINDKKISNRVKVGRLDSQIYRDWTKMDHQIYVIDRR